MEHQHSSIDIDTIIRELGLGKFHFINFIFIGLSIFINCLTGATFIFTARDPEYRCFISECDTPNSDFRQPWLSNAIPFTDKIPSKCERFAVINNSSTECRIDDFQHDIIEKCDQWIYGEGDTIIKEFGIPCEKWKRTLVGTVNSVGQFVCLSVSGLISDTIGRRNVIVYATILSGLFGIAQSFAVDYWSFLFFEFLVTVIGSGAYSASFILGIEIMVPERRVYGSTIMNLACAIATICLGIAAWIVPNWRQLQRAAYLPSILMILSLWIFPESVRWLFVKGKHYEGGKVFRKAAAMNKIKFSDKISKYLEYVSPADDKLNNIESNQEKLIIKVSKEEKLPLKIVFKSKTLMLRFIVCAFCWITNAFVYYGFLLNAVSIFGSDINPYLNFSLAAVVELPAQGIVILFLDRIGRRRCLCSSLIGSALSCFLFVFIPSDLKVISLVLYMCGKLFITVSFNVIYIYTTELFPTSLRHSILACCSMVGRIGSMLAPQTPLLEKYYSNLPMLLFGITATISGLSILIFPETLNVTLPDTIQQAENIGNSDFAKQKGKHNQVNFL